MLRPHDAPTTRKATRRKTDRARGAARARELEADAAVTYRAEEKRLVALRDPDALTRDGWRREGRTLAALRSLAAAFTGKARVRVLRAGEDGHPEALTCPDRYEGPPMVWTRSGQTNGSGVPEPLYCLSFTQDSRDAADEQLPPEKWGDLIDTAPLEAKAQHRLKVAQARCGWTVEGVELGDTGLLVVVPRPEGRLYQAQELHVCQRCRAPTDRATEPCAPCRRAEQLWHAWVNAERERRGAAARAAHASAGKRAALEQAADLRKKAAALEAQFSQPPHH